MKAECYKCGKEYAVKMDTEAEKENIDNLVSNYDPTDWECPDCEKAEQEAEDKIADKEEL